MIGSDEHQAKLQRILAKDGRFAADAYVFIEQVVSLAAQELKAKGEQAAKRQISGQELLLVAKKLLLQSYGPLAIEVLDSWQVRRTEDFGDIVFNLVEVGLLGTSPEDSKDDFANGYDFTAAFVEPFVAHGPGPDLPVLDME